MHATIEQLLSLRDNEPVSIDVKRHVSVCMFCHKQLEELTLVKDELKRLPAHISPNYNWTGILNRADQIRENAYRRGTLALHLKQASTLPTTRGLRWLH